MISRQRLHFLVLLLLWLGLKIWFAVGSAPALLSSYADDFLVIPLVMGAALWAQQYLVSAAHFYTRLSVALAWLYFTLFFELILPRLHPGFTADWRDAIAYGAGAVYFYVFLNKPDVIIRD